MNEALAGKANEALTAILDTAIATGDFVKDQAPDVIRQLLAWSFTMSLIWFMCGIALVATTVVLAKMAWKKCCEEVCFEPMAVVIAVAVFVIVGGICLVAENIEWLQIAIAPKIFLIEYAANLVTK